MIINDVKERAQDLPSQSPSTPLPSESSGEVDHPPPPYQADGHDGLNSLPSLVAQSFSAPDPTTLSSSSNHLESSSDVQAASKENTGRRRLTGRVKLALGLVAILTAGLAGCAIFLPVYFKVIKPRDDDAKIEMITSGGNGSRIVMDDGTEFVYSNPFGGFWVHDPDDPFKDAAQPNSWTPPLNTSWDFTTHRIHGVNLGGLFILERMTSPAIFQRYPGPVDEWDLSVAMANDPSNGGLSQIEEHYQTFITEKDIADIAGTGLTWIRLPIGFWAIETWSGEPFLERTSWKYIVRVFQWCRKYGLRVNLALYSVPGSANGGTIGGKWGQLEFLSGVMGIANAQRTLYYIRVLAEFISRSEWTNVVPMLSIVHSPGYRAIGVNSMRSFYSEAYRTVREATGYGAGNGPYLVMFDGTDSSSGIFDDNFMSGADRVILERQPWFVELDPNHQPVDENTASSPYHICRWGPLLNQSRALHGITIGSEFTADFFNCGLIYRADVDSDYRGGCSSWIFTPIGDWSLGIKSTLLQYVSAQMDTLGDFFFFTWKIGPTNTSEIRYPLWSYQLGHQHGWIPHDPRKASGVCQRLPGPVSAPTVSATWDGSYQPAMTGAFGTTSALPTSDSRYPWPPTALTLGNGRSATPSQSLPTYTSTGTPIVLPGPTYTITDSQSNTLKTISTGEASTLRATVALAPAPTFVAGCDYPDPWDAHNIEFTQVCGGTYTDFRTITRTRRTPIPTTTSRASSSAID